jgi:ribosomal protein S18 acetylase RimI-like enzyme
VEARERYRQVAALHAASIDRGFLATLGIPFLALMYEAIDEGQDSVLLVEERDGRVSGFVSGGCGMRSIYGRMLSHPMRLALALLPSLFRPSRLQRIFEILRYGRSSSGMESWPSAELLSIAVEPAARGGGVAESLYRRLVDHFHAAGQNSFKIVVGEGLEPAQRFYRRMGAIPVGRIEVHAGEWSTVFVDDRGMG